MYDPVTSGSKVVALVEVFEALQSFEKVLIRGPVLCGVKQMYYGDG
jgi:hypothetical protein